MREPANRSLAIQPMRGVGMRRCKPGAGRDQAALRDPQQREGVRVRERGYLGQRWPELARALGLDTRLGERLWDLLTQQRMAQLDRASDPAYTGAITGDEGTRELAAIRTLLGEDGFQRYLDYMDTLSERSRVAELAKQLEASEPLSTASRTA